jgi:stage V sporulation protein AA
MKAGFTPTLYLRLRKKVKITKGFPIYLGHIAQILVEPEYEKKLHQLILYQPTDKDGNLVLIDMLRIVKKVKELFPQMTIEQYGEPHVLVEICREIRPPSLILIALVWFLLFIGSGLAIMNFHEDVSMLEVHQRIYELITGQRVEHPLFLQIPYSIGIGLGMVIFFNHLFKKKFNEEPSPLEVEMYMYQENMNHYIVTEEYSKMQERSQERS